MLLDRMGGDPIVRIGNGNALRFKICPKPGGDRCGPEAGHQDFKVCGKWGQPFIVDIASEARCRLTPEACSSFLVLCFIFVRNASDLFQAQKLGAESFLTFHQILGNACQVTLKSSAQLVAD